MRVVSRRRWRWRIAIRSSVRRRATSAKACVRSWRNGSPLTRIADLSEERWFYLRGGEASLLVEAAPSPLWGARLDVPSPPCVLPGMEGGYFGLPALAPQHTQGWTLDDAEEDDDGFTLKLALQGAQATRIEIDYRLSEHGVLQMR